MQSYQEEYITNLKDIAVLTARKKPEHDSFEEYWTECIQAKQKTEQKIKRNMKLLRDNLFPVLDHLLEASQDELTELQEFAATLLNDRKESDIGLFCRIHQALLNLARLKKDQNSMIRELYWVGMGRYYLCNKLIGLELPIIEKYIFQMRLCFTEAAAYLKYYDEIEDTDTRGYILRSKANIALGQFKTVSEKIHLVKQTLQILQDKEYQKKAPKLPWSRYIYMTHQQMTASISYTRENTMTAQDIADIMDSAYIVYQKRIQEASAQNEKPPIRSAFSYYAIEYYCGLDTLDGLLTKMEHLINSADPSLFTTENIYGLISLPAFYCQYLKNFPERIPERKGYIENLYQKILDYVEVFPNASENQTLFLYLRQLSHTYVETKNAIPYGTFLQKLLIRFTPDTYIHSYAVGKAATVFCEIIISEEPNFFDDIEHIRKIENLKEKQKEILDYAMGCGFFHDIGKINFIDLYSHMARQWFEDEYEMARLHTIVGEICLSSRPSTQRYAKAALGHHSWYDGSHGYPDSYKRLECSCRQMIDVIGLIDWLENITETARLYTGQKKTFDEAVETAISLEGKRFSPLLTARLRDKEITRKIKLAFIEGRKEAYRQLYREENGKNQKVRKRSFDVKKI